MITKSEVYKDVKQAIQLCQKEIENKCDDSILRWLTTSNSFSEISQCYQFTNEAIDKYYQLLNLKDKNVLTVCGSGDQIIYAIMQDAKNIDVFDSNKLTYYYLFLKLSVISHLEYNEFLDFMNLYTSDNNQLKYYKQIRDSINNNDIKTFWDIFFGKQEHLFPALFMGNHNDLGAKPQDWSSYINLNRPIVTYLNEEYFYRLKRKLKINNSTIRFKCVDLLNVAKYYNGSYDFINCSNIIDYINNPKVIFDFFINIIDHNLNQEGLIILNYYWHIFNKMDHQKLQDLFTTIDPDIYTFITNDIYHESVLTYKKHQ